MGRTPYSPRTAQQHPGWSVLSSGYPSDSFLRTHCTLLLFCPSSAWPVTVLWARAQGRALIVFPGCPPGTLRSVKGVSSPPVFLLSGVIPASISFLVTSGLNVRGQECLEPPSSKPFWFCPLVALVTLRLWRPAFPSSVLSRPMVSLNSSVLIMLCRSAAGVPSSHFKSYCHLFLSAWLSRERVLTFTDAFSILPATLPLHLSGPLLLFLHLLTVKG